MLIYWLISLDFILYWVNWIMTDLLLLLSEDLFQEILMSTLRNNLHLMSFAFILLLWIINFHP